MHARALTIFVFLLLAGAAWPASQQKTLSWNDQSTPLYEIYTTSGYAFINLKPGFSGAFTSTLSIDDSKVLSYGSGGSLDGAVLCPGATASLDSSMSGSWSAPNFYAFAEVWETCTPGASSATGGNFPVSWNKADYDAISSVSICNYNNPTCWGHEGALNDKKIDVYDNYGTQITNRLGTVAVTCWGTRTPSATTPSGSYPGLSPSDSGLSFHNTVPLSNLGSYAIKDSYEVKGCAATVRHPVCGKYQGEEVYSRISAQAGAGAPPYDAALGTNVYNIVVENRQNALSCGLSGAQPLSMQAGSYTVIPVTISDTGQVANYVTGVTSDNPALAAAAFNNMLCAQSGGDRPSTNPECCQNPPSCTSVPSNGFGPSGAVNPGGSRTLYVQVAVPAGTAEGSYSAKLAFSFSSDQPACNVAARQASACNIDAVQVDVGPGDRCAITDGTMPVHPGETRTFSVQCAHLKGDLGPCTGSSVAWAITPPDFGTLGANDYASADVTFPAPGTGDVSADVTGDFKASCAYSDSGQPVSVQGVSSCIITPSPASVGYSEITPFSLECLDDSGNPLPCGSVDWELQGIDARLFDTGPTGASIFTTSGIGTTGTLSAAIGPVSCSSDLTVVPPTNTIAVNPPSVDLPFMGGQIFNTNCTHVGNSVACAGVQWNPTDFPAVDGEISPDTGPMTNYTATVDNTATELWACASGMAPTPCNFTSITVGAKPVPGVMGCNVTPPEASVGRLEVAAFGLVCFNNTNNTVPCVSASWELQGMEGILFDTGSTGASVVPISDIGTTGKLNATVGNVSCASNLTVVPPNNTLAINPPAASLSLGDNQTFNTSCTINGTPVACSGVLWDPFPDPLFQVIGSINPDRGPDTVYTATTDNISTTLWACAFDMRPAPCNFTQIDVGTQANPPDCPGCRPGPSSDYCTIFDEGGRGYYRVMCGPPGKLKQCNPDSVIWQLSTGTSPGSKTTRVQVFTTVPAQLVAIVGKDKSCSIDIGASTYQCLAYS